MRYTDKQLSSFADPLSESEENRAENVVNMVKEALDNCESMNKYDYEVFLQGSYAANTNVRQNSDVDVCVMLKTTIEFQPIKGLTASDYGLYPSTCTYEEYRSDIRRALQDKFGVDSITDGNKSLKIMGNTYHLSADVVPSFQYRNYAVINSRQKDIFAEGVAIKPLKENRFIVNYPKLNLDNGRIKNQKTGHCYKNFVRIVKRIHYCMVEDGVVDKDLVSSYVLETVIYAFRSEFFNSNCGWNAMLRDLILSLRDFPFDRFGNYLEIDEINGLQKLFRQDQKCKPENLQRFMVLAWDYLGYA